MRQGENLLLPSRQTRNLGDFGAASLTASKPARTRLKYILAQIIMQPLRLVNASVSAHMVDKMAVAGAHCRSSLTASRGTAAEVVPGSPACQ